MKKVKIFGLFLLILFSYSLFSVETQATTIEGVSFYDGLIPGYEIEYEVKESKVTPEEHYDFFRASLMSDAYPAKGDIIRIKFLQDPDDLDITKLELFTVAEPWAEFYLNDVFMTNDSTLLDYIDFSIVPITVQLSTGNKSAFDYYYDENDHLQHNNESGYFEMINEEKEFTIKEKYSLFSGVHIIEHEIVFNKDWGVRKKYDYKHTILEIKRTYVIYFAYKILNKDIVPYNWSISLLAISMIAVLVLIRRRKKI